MKNKFIFGIIGIITLSTILTFWVRQLTKIEDFDIFGDIEDEEDL
jgi:hypothetical protein